MWAALRSDLAEFVHTVAEEGSNALSIIDQNIGSDNEGQDQLDAIRGEESDEEDENFDLEDELARLRSLKETYTIPLLPLDDDTKSTNSAERPNDEETGSKTSESVEEDDDDEDYKEIKHFLSTFDPASQTDNISEILETHNSTKGYFESLVPTEVSYDQFWKRYFFRCDPIRIEKLLNQELEEQERARQARAAAFQGGISSVKNLFGEMSNAVAAVSGSVKTNRDAYVAAAREGAGPTGSLLSGRPPFALNTALSDEDEEEEELGWDSDEEDSIDAGSRSHEDSYDDDEEVVFSSPVKSKSDIELKTLEDERDMLKEMVEVQSNEIKQLQKKLSSDTNFGKVEALEMRLFEKDSEIAALKASLSDADTHNDNPVEKYADKLNEQSTKIESLEKELALAKSQLSSLQHLEQANTSDDLSDAPTNENMRKLTDKIDALNGENENLRNQNQEMSQKIIELDTQVSKLTSSNQTLAEELELAQKTIQDKEILFSKTLEDERARTQSLESDSLPSSLSSCVKVGSHAEEKNPTDIDQPAQKEQATLKENEDEDDWGDSWGDDE